MSDSKLDPEEERDVRLAIKDTTSNLYRIVPEVKELILTVLAVFERLPTDTDRATISMARQALTFPLETNTSEPAQPAPITKVEPPPVDAIKEAQFRNVLTVIRRTVETEMGKADPANREQFARILARIPSDI